MASGGYGRGGRGAALLEKLQKEAARRPGVQEDSPGGAASAGQTPETFQQRPQQPHSQKYQQQHGYQQSQQQYGHQQQQQQYAPQQTYGQQQSFGQQQQFGQQSYGQQQTYGQQQSFGQQQSHGQQQPHGQPQQSFGQQQQFGQQFYGQPQQSVGHQQQFGQQSYGQQQLPQETASRPKGRGMLMQQMMAEHSQQQQQQPAVPGYGQMSTPHGGPNSGANGHSNGRGRGHRSPPQPQQSAEPSVGVQATGMQRSRGQGFDMSEMRTSLPTSGPERGERSPVSRQGPAGGEPVQTQEEDAPVIMRGTSGDPVELTTNYVALRCLSGGVYQYAVFFNPPVDSMNIRRSLLNEHTPTLGRAKTFDGNILFLPKQLPDKETIFTSTRRTDNQVIELTVRLVKVLPPSACIQLYNVLFKRILNILKMTPIGRHYYSPSGAVSISQHKLELWPGYITAITEYEGGVMLNADVSHRVLRTQSVHDVMKEISTANRNNYQEECSRRLVGQIVITKYNNRTYRIDEIAFNKSPSDTFERRGVPISFVEYYQSEYGIKINNIDQPLLISLDKKSEKKQDPRQPKREFISLLVPEISYMTGITDEMRKDFRVMKDLAAHTRVTPAQRRLSLKKFCDNVNSNPEAKQQLENWGLALDNDIMEMQGRLLRMEKIVVNRQMPDGQDAGIKADWSRALCNNVLSTVHLENWLLVVTQRDMDKAERFVHEYKNCGRAMGIQVYQPTVCQIPTDKTEAYLREIRNRMTDEVQLVMAIFPSLRDDRYNAVKQLCCADAPVPSQVIMSRTISDDRKLRSVTQKIALQINCKLGGELWGVKIPSKDLMVCGVDTYHDSLTKRNRSVAALVVSVNRECTRYYSCVHMQKVGEELVNGLKVMFLKALRKYYSVNHCLPQRVVMFRDGVGDGQLSVVKDFEVPQLVDCFKHFEGAEKPKFTMIVVQKRINTRLFSRQGSGMQARLDNPCPGTVVDHTVTRRNYHDFFLISQHITQGTVTPTHYVVLVDQSGWKPDILQALSYKMTHMYYNWPGTIRVPAPCQYAHKLAYLVGNHMGKEHDELLSDRLFYL